MVNYQFRKVKLINPQDIVYLNFCAKCKLEKQSLRVRLPQTATNKLSLIFERTIRNWLGEQLPLLPERILSFEEQCSQFGYIQKYREIDAVSVHCSQPDFLFEIKTSSNSNPKSVIRQAAKQLRKSQYIASQRWSNLKICIIYIDILPRNIHKFSELSLSEVNFYKTLDSLRKNVVEEKISCFICSGIEIWQMAIEKGLSDTFCLWTEAQIEIEQNVHKRLEREALIAKGIPIEEWPEFLREENKTRSAPQIVQFGEFSGETTLGNAFRNAQQKQKRKSRFLVTQ